MPIPGGEFEAEMLFGGEVARQRSEQTNDEENRADDHVGAMKARGHEKRGAVNVAAESEVRVRVLVSLHAGEREAKRDGQDQAPFQSLPVIFKQSMVRPGHRRAGCEKDQRVQQRQVPRVKSLDALRRPYATRSGKATNLLRISREQC